MVSHNTKLVHTKYERIAKPISINKIIRRVDFRRLAKTHRANLLKKSKSYIQKKILKSSQDQDYGNDCQKPDMEKPDYDETVDEFLSSIKRTEEEAKELEEETRFQSENGKWLEERRKLLTASNFAKICKRRKNGETLQKQLKIYYILQFWTT
jgi:hypothetical protein